jgi:hypothetical protein
MFPLVKTLNSGHPAEHGIDFDVVPATHAHTDTELKAVFPFPPVKMTRRKGAGE